MKNINRNIIQITFLAFIIFWGCGKKDELVLLEPSHRVIFTSEMDFQNKIQVTNSLSFGDVSAGVESRTWTFPAGVDILDSDNDQTSTEANVTANFNQIGVFPVQLSQTFKKDAYVEETLQGRNLDTTIMVTVLDSITAALEAVYILPDGTIGDPLNLTDNAENVLAAARDIRFTYTGTGGPEQLYWELVGGDPEIITSRDMTLDVKYKFLGNYDLRMIAFRDRPFGRDTIEVKNFIKVVESTDPLVVDEITEKDGNIAVVFSREIEPDAINKEDFFVKVINSWKYENDPVIASASIDPDQGNVVILELIDETLYNDDEIKVTYTPGEIISLDGVKADGFEEVLLVFEQTNLLENYAWDWSFENSNSEDWQYLGWDGDEWQRYVITMSEEKAFSGDRSMHLEFLDKGGMAVSLKDASGENITFPAKAGQAYEVGIWVNIKAYGNNNPTGLNPDLRLYWGPDTNWGIGPNPELVADIPLDTWTYSKDYFEFAETGDDKFFMIRGFNASNQESLEVFIDNVVLAEVTLRP